MKSGETSSEEELYPHQQFLRSLFEPIIGKYPPEESRKDLDNFSSYGWKQGWEEPEEGPDDAPRFRLLRIQRAFWEREVRLTFNHSFGADGETNYGNGNSQTYITLLPGARWAIVKDCWTAVGYDFPVTSQKDFDDKIWFSLYLDF